MRWDERSSTTLHRPLLSVCLFHTVTSTQTQSYTHSSFLFLSRVPLLSCSAHHISRTYWHKHFLLALSHTYVRNLQLSHSPSPTPWHMHTYTLSSLVLFPYVSFFRLIKIAAPSPFPGEQIHCDTTVLACEVKRYSATPCGPLTQPIRLMGWQVPAETRTQPVLTCYWLSSTY